MDPLACPGCGAPCLSVWAKLSLGPARATRCPRCNARVGVSWPAALVMLVLGSLLPLVGGVAAAAAVGSSAIVWLPAAAFAAGTVLVSVPLSWFYYRFVPLVVRGV